MAADGVGAEETERLGDWAAAEPSSYAEWCLDRIATALEVLVLAQQMARSEPQPAAEPGTLLPEDFPGREQLAVAGIIHLEALPKKAAGLAALGLDGATVNKVLTYMKTAL